MSSENLTPKQIVGAVIGIVLLAAGFVWVKEQERPVSPPPLPLALVPSVTVDGRAKDVLTFGPWTADGMHLRSNMTAKDPAQLFRVQAVRFSAYDSVGVKVDEGPVDFPTLRGGETVKASILLLHDKETARVVLEVN